MLQNKATFLPVILPFLLSFLVFSSKRGRERRVMEAKRKRATGARVPAGMLDWKTSQIHTLIIFNRGERKRQKTKSCGISRRAGN